MDDQPACRHIKPDLAASFMPCGSLNKASSQQTLELLQDLLPERPEKGGRCTGEPKCPGANANSAGSPGGDVTKQSMAEANLQGDCTSSQTPPTLRLRDGDYLAACLLAPQGLCSVGESEEDEMRLSRAGLFSAGKHKVSLKKPQQRDVDTQQVLKLLMKQQEVVEARGLVKLREAEKLQLQQRLRIEQKKSAHLTAGFERICEALQTKLSVTGSENPTGQLRDLLDKYDRLRKRATSTKSKLLQEVKGREQIQRRLEETQREKEELGTKQRLLHEQKEAALKELSISNGKLQAVEKQRDEVAREKEALEEEALALRSEVGRLTQQLGKTQRESKRLVRSARSRDLEREASLKALQELQEAVKRLYTKLEECSTEKQAVRDEMEALKQEAKLLHNRQRVELLQLQEEHKHCGESKESLRHESDALAKLVTDLKQDKLMLKEEVEVMQRERLKTETSRAEEGERLREAVYALEKERQVLLAEMEVLRQDYVALSDRIAQRMAQVEQEDGPMSLVEMAPMHQANTGQSKLEHTSATGPVLTEDSEYIPF